MKYTVYEKSGDLAGAIKRYGDVMQIEDAKLMPWESEQDVGVLFEETLDVENKYVVDDHVADRPVMLLTISTSAIIANGRNQSVIGRIPAGAVVQIGERVVEPTDGSITLTSTIPGTYHVTVQHWPHLDFETTIEAT